MKKKKLCLVLICLVLLYSSFENNYISCKTNSSVLGYASIEAKRFANLLIHTSVSNVVEKEKINGDILTLTKNSNGEIQMIDFDAKSVNSLLQDVSVEIQNNILKLENGDSSFLPIGKSLRGESFKHVRSGVVCELKGGGIFGNSLFANTGPSIPIKLSFIGEVLTNIQTSIKSYGINNAYLEVDISVKVDMRITMPLSTKDKSVTKNIPIAMKVIQGRVPNYYHDMLEKSSESYSLPLEE